FFFSSRRRRTRFSRDWSSDVCSSDLLYAETSAISVPSANILPQLQAQAEAAVRLLGFTPTPSASDVPRLTVTLAELKYQSPKERSEERRVGKESRARWSACHEATRDT